MKRIVFTLVAFAWVLFGNTHANADNKPYWITNRPQTETTCMYYYRVTQGEGSNYDKAYANAFAKAILESSWKLGVEVNTTDDLNTIEKGINANISVGTASMVLPLNKVCEYIEPLSGRMGIRMYILWQVAKYGNRAPNFDEFTKCE